MSDLTSHSADLNHKELALRLRIASLGSLLVAYSGGTDSAFLAWAAYKMLGRNMLALLADSPSLPRRELRLAREFAETWGIPLTALATHEISRTEYTRNDASRCSHCKNELFALMECERKLARWILLRISYAEQWVVTHWALCHSFVHL